MAPPVAEDLTALSRFQSLWQRCQIDGTTDDSAAIHQRLVTGYNEPQRCYHTLAHIEHCLSMFDQCKSLVENSDALELAIWFHDVIFEPGNRDNEALSAELYLELSNGVQDIELRELVARMIMATLHDGSSLEDSDTRYMVDIDLSGFGSPWEQFFHDSQNIRTENPQLSDDEYYRNQGNFQTKLLARPRFFLSDHFYQRYEQQARDNLSRYFDHIREQH